MLFNSLGFVFVFLPLALAITYSLGRWSQTAAKVALLVLSLVFYAAWRVGQTPLLLFSIGFNFVIGALIQRCARHERPLAVRLLLLLGILVDVALLGWFKYANFLADNLNEAFGAQIVLAHIALPLAISFFTFQKIAYLIDTVRGETDQISLLDFSVFAAFFPQLIAGPIVHFKEVVPQIRSRRFTHLIPRNLLVGLVMFAIGLFKKTVISDTLATFVDPLFGAAHNGAQFTLVTGWVAAISFTCQLYFDFSGYSDMAIGLGRMLGVKLPLNFHSPLRAPDIIEYWRRWHMTLQRFIVPYIFQPLSVPLTRFAAARGLSGWSAFALTVGVPVMVTFTVVGVWHGAGWTFLLFGVIHGLYIFANQAWRERLTQHRRRLRRAGVTPAEPGVGRIAARHAITLMAVVFSNVIFRARTVADAGAIWRGMVGLNGPDGALATSLHWGLGLPLVLGAAIAVIFLAPNTQQIMGRWDPALNWREWRDVGRPAVSWSWRPSPAGLAFAGAVLFMGVMFIQRGRAVFIYFNF
jgi:D-alanyl-lipoteichoic acid acyltransferase DltB (MBOAT superfamily)